MIYFSFEPPMIFVWRPQGQTSNREAADMYSQKGQLKTSTLPSTSTLEIFLKFLKEELSQILEESSHRIEEPPHTLDTSSDILEDLPPSAITKNVRYRECCTLLGINSIREQSNKKFKCYNEECHWRFYKTGGGDRDEASLQSYIVHFETISPL